MLWTDDEAAGPLYLQTDDGVIEVPLEEGDQASRLSAEDAVVKSLGLPGEFKAGLSLYIRSDMAFLESLAGSTPPSPGLEPAIVAHRLADLAYRSAGAGQPMYSSARKLS